jgi:hypothetical protein
MPRRVLTVGISLAVLVGTSLVSREAFAQGDVPQTKGARRGPGGGPGAAAGATARIRPYDEVITSEAKSFPGLFHVFRIDDKIFYEIPQSTLGKDMLWVTQIEKTSSGSGYAGDQVGHRVVRWELRGENDVLLRDVKYDIRADTKDPIRNAVQASSVEPIIAVLPVKAFGKDKSLVVEATELFTGDLPEFSAGRRLNAGSPDARKTFIEAVKAFPENIETKVLLTYRRTPGGQGAPIPTPSPEPTPDPTPRRGPRGGGGGGGGGGTVTMLVHHSMVKLPDEPMKPRKQDERVGFFTEEFLDYGDIRNHQVEDVRYITRWRLEKKDPDAEVSEPKKPIVYYISREVPDRLRPFIKKGIESWQPAFEKAGFKNAIIAKDAPTLLEEPNWDPEDARYSTIRWLPSTTENAMGPHVHDPRTGEILEADILMYHNVLKLARDWYFVQASPNDPRAQQLPLPDDLVGELLSYIVAHEVGHTLGFPHNMKASSSFTVAQLRDPKFTTENGTEASIMDYGRFNYVAQPGDGARLIPKIGPYDTFAVEWGYKTFKGANTYEQEKAKLDEIVARQLKDPTLRFGGGSATDPSEQTEDLGSDAIAATELGLKNIDRVAAYLVKATAKKGEDYDQLSNMYRQLVSQRNRELMHVAQILGGSVKTTVFYGDGDRTFESIAGDQQKKAIAFLNAKAFQVPTTLIAPDIVQRLEANGAADRILQSQRQLLSTLMNEQRIKRMAEQATRESKGAYAPLDMMTDLRSGIWGELRNDPVDVDLYGRNLQRTHAEMLISEVTKETSTSDLPALARGELRAVLAEIAACDQKKVATMTRLHLDDLKARITQALEPKTFLHQSAPTGSGRIILGGDAHEDGQN